MKQIKTIWYILIIQLMKKVMTKVYASVFNPNAEPLELLPVETEREWKVIETIITSIEEENKKNNETNN